jgi:hypothetical protein
MTPCQHLKKLGQWCGLANGVKCAEIQNQPCPMLEHRRAEWLAGSSQSPLESPCHVSEHQPPHATPASVLELGAAVARELEQTLQEHPAELKLPSEVVELTQVTKLKHHPALAERRLEALRSQDPEARARAIAALQDLDGFQEQAKSIRDEAEAIADTWLPELEQFVLGPAKTKIVKAIAVMMLEARLWTFGGAEHFFCSLPDIAALSGLSLRSVQRHLSPKDPRAHILNRWLSRRSVYGSRVTGEACRIGTVFRFRLERVPIENLEPCPNPRLEALRAPWRFPDELPGARAAAREIELESQARYRPDGTPVLESSNVPDDNRHNPAGLTTFPTKTGNVFNAPEVLIEGVHLTACFQKPMNSYNRQSREMRQIAQNAEREAVGREPKEKLEAARLRMELVAQKYGTSSRSYEEAVKAFELCQDEWALAVLPTPRIGAFKRMDEALEHKARAVARRLGDELDNVPFWKYAFKKAGNDALIFAAVSETLEASRNNRIRESLAKYCVGVLKRSKVIPAAGQVQLFDFGLEGGAVEVTEVRLN